jgi:hypothetical protein
MDDKDAFRKVMIRNRTIQSIGIGIASERSRLFIVGLYKFFKERDNNKDYINIPEIFCSNSATEK